MKSKITVRIPEPVAQRLDAAIELLGVRKSAVIERALDRFLSPDSGGPR